MAHGLRKIVAKTHRQGPNPVHRRSNPTDQRLESCSSHVTLNSPRQLGVRPPVRPGASVKRRQQQMPLRPSRRTPEDGAQPRWAGRIVLPVNKNEAIKNGLYGVHIFYATHTPKCVQCNAEDICSSYSPSGEAEAAPGGGGKTKLTVTRERKSSLSALCPLSSLEINKGTVA